MAFEVPQQDMSPAPVAPPVSTGFTVPQQDMAPVPAAPQGSTGFTVPQSDASQTPKSGMDFWEAMRFAGRLGITDTVRGGAQLQSRDSWTLYSRSMVHRLMLPGWVVYSLTQWHGLYLSVESSMLSMVSK